MYKTVRHGENSLQYKILAQQEEGVANVKCQKPPRTVTAKLITVIVLLIVGIIASAVLVPLVLTNDFIALTGTFQKFSVSTLRRSHSGNHVVVLAKKPYGWNAPHSSVSPRLFSASQTHSNEVKKTTVGLDAPSTTNESTDAVQTTKITVVENLYNKIAPDQPGEKKQTGNSATVAVTDNIKKEQLLIKPSPTVSAIQQQKSFHRETAEGDKVSSSLEPVWFEPVKHWSFGSSSNFINGMSGIVTNLLFILGSFFFVVVIIIMFYVLRKTLPKKRTLIEKETAESKEDKTRLLKPSVSSDHDED